MYHAGILSEQQGLDLFAELRQREPTGRLPRRFEM